ncbi:MAG: T9SS type A sorting domain-containing protein [Bacteroidia bacterium]|nr:T9SS type A sorting domain-containing protein [Bacteroidia bacterium]
MKTLHFSLKWILITGCCFLCSGLCAQAPEWEWAKSFGSPYDDFSGSVATDHSGNIYITGYDGDTIFPKGYFTAKYDSTGILQWMKGSSGGEGLSCTIDNSGNIYVCGIFGHSITFDDSILACSASGMFITKYNPSGNVLWVKSICGNVQGQCITSDENCNIYLTGKYWSPDPIYFDTLFLPGSNQYDLFVAKFDSSGNTIWIRTAGGNQEDNSESISRDLSGGINITGYFQSSSIVFGNDTLINSVPASENMFIVKYDENGNTIWAKNANNINSSTSIGIDICCDNNGDILVSGGFSGIIYFDSATFLTSVNLNEFIAKYSPDGNLVWAKRIGNADIFYMNPHTHLMVDNSCNAYVLGAFQDTILEIGYTILTSYNFQAGNYFIAKYDNSGNPVWAVAPKGGGLTQIGGIKSDLSGSIYITGGYSGSFIIVGNDTLHNISAEFTDNFLAKLSSTVNSIKLPETDNSVIVFPNPSTGKVNITNLPVSGQLQVINSTGQTLKKVDFKSQSSLNITLSESGIYFIRIISGNEVVTKKVVVCR